MRRDFSQATVDALYRTIETIKNDGQWGIVDFFTDLWMVVPDMSDVKAYQRAVLDKYDVGEAELDTILQTVGAVDSSYQMSLILCANTVEEFGQKIKNVADLITPVVVSYDQERFTTLGGAICANYGAAARSMADMVDGLSGVVAQMLDDQEPWYEKLLNGVGGFAVAVVDGVVISPLAEIFGLADLLFGTNAKDNLKDLWGQAEDSILDAWVTNQKWYFGGKVVGDATVFVGGAVLTAVGLATIVGSVTVGVAGIGLSATGVGAVVGVPAIAVSWAGVAEGVALAGAGLTMMASGPGKMNEDIIALSKVHQGGTAPRDFRGEPVKAPEAYDPAAEGLAKRIGGDAQMKFPNDPHEFDAISDQYVAQSKPADYYNQKWRKQAQATFEAAKATGRQPYFHFDGSIHPDALRALERYAERYGVEYVLDLAPLQ